MFIEALLSCRHWEYRVGRTDKNSCPHGDCILLQPARQRTNKSAGMTNGDKVLQSPAGRRGNRMLEEGRFAVLNKVTFEQSPGDEGDPADVLGKSSSEGTASAETTDLIHSHSCSAPCFYRLFFYILVILLIKIRLLSCTLQLT